MTEDLLCDVSDGVMTLVMNRPQVRNALTPEMVHALIEHLSFAANDSSVVCVVLTGSGNAFCSGGDIRAMDTTVPESARTLDLKTRSKASWLLHTIPKPTVAVIPGAAAGAGFSLALACDFRIAVEDAKLVASFVRVGLSGDLGVSYFLPRLIGVARATELLMLSPTVLARQAFEFGLVNQVTTAAKLEVDAAEFVTRLRRGPSLAYAAIKSNLGFHSKDNFDRLIEHEARNQAICASGDDHRAAVDAYLQKR